MVGEVRCWAEAPAYHAPCIIQSEAHIERVAADLRVGESRIAGVLKVKLCTVEALHEQSEPHTHSHIATKELKPVSILARYALVSEETYLVVKHIQSHTMIVLQKINGHVGSDKCRLRIMLKAGKVYGISTCDIQDRSLANGGRVEIGLHHPVMTERRVVLSPHSP